MIQSIRKAKFSSKRKNTMRKSRNSNNRKTKTHSTKMSGIQTGGDDGRYSLPAEYFGGKSGAYFPDGSSNLNLTGQLAVSRGVIHQDGRWAGPDLRPMMSGGGCGCGGRRGRSQKNRSGRSSRKVRRNSNSRK